MDTSISVPIMPEKDDPCVRISEVLSIASFPITVLTVIVSSVEDRIFPIIISPDRRVITSENRFCGNTRRKKIENADMPIIFLILIIQQILRAGLRSRAISRYI